MTIIDCPMCPWKAGVESKSPYAKDYVQDMHFAMHCEQFARELDGIF